jgi:hypothetical protein
LEIFIKFEEILKDFHPRLQAGKKTDEFQWTNQIPKLSKKSFKVYPRARKYLNLGRFKKIKLKNVPIGKNACSKKKYILSNLHVSNPCVMLCG